MTRILFVDDESHVLAGLHDLLRKQRRDWTLVFAPGGETALEALDAVPFDVVVSDMRMPGLDGARLLKYVQNTYPETVRIVLSGQAPQESALKLANVAHRFLSKPCKFSELVTAIESSLRFQALLQDDAVCRAATGAGALPSAPGLYAALTDELANPDVTVDAIAAIVERDLAMCAKVLQLVNSAFFGIGRRITNVRDAVVYLGIGTLKALVLLAGAFEAFKSAAPVEGFSLDSLESHSSLVARVARGIVGPEEADDAFLAGLLHDLGKLVLAAHRPDELADLVRESTETGVPLYALERERSGVTHAEIGAYLLALWGLPHPVVAAVAEHHTPPAPGEEPPGTRAAVWAANIFAREQVATSSEAGAADRDHLETLGTREQLAAWRALLKETG